MREEGINITQKMIEENIEMTKKLAKDMKRVKRYMALQNLLSLFWILLVVVPLVLSIIYLPPLIAPYIEPIKQGINLQKQILQKAGELDFNFLNTAEPQPKPSK